MLCEQGDEFDDLDILWRDNKSTEGITLEQTSHNEPTMRERL